jgi:hypothetical protein
VDGRRAGPSRKSHDRGGGGHFLKAHEKDFAYCCFLVHPQNMLTNQFLADCSLFSFYYRCYTFFNFV